MTIKLPSTKQPIHKLRQSTAFPPNFIHSLDATHMFNSAMKSYEKYINNIYIYIEEYHLLLYMIVIGVMQLMCPQ